VAPTSQAVLVAENINLTTKEEHNNAEDNIEGMDIKEKRGRAADSEVKDARDHSADKLLLLANNNDSRNLEDEAWRKWSQEKCSEVLCSSSDST